jgi:hypothetical protein
MVNEKDLEAALLDIGKSKAKVLANSEQGCE